MHREPVVGLDPRSPGSCPGPKAGAKPLHHPGFPRILFLLEALALGTGCARPSLGVPLEHGILCSLARHAGMPRYAFSRRTPGTFPPSELNHGGENKGQLGSSPATEDVQVRAIPVIREDTAA